MDSVKDLLRDKLKGQRHAQGVLCALFREVLLWKGITLLMWNRRLTTYFEKPHNMEKPDIGNLNKTLLNDDLPWIAFKKAIDFLGPLSAKLDIEIEKADGSVSKYWLWVDPTEDEANSKVNQHLVLGDCEVFKNAKKPDSILAILFRHIIEQEGIDQAKWDQLFVDYQNDPVHNVGVTAKDVSSNSNTLRRSLLSDTLSWNVFRKGILLLKPRSESYTLHMHWTDDPKLKEFSEDGYHRIYVPNPHWDATNAKDS
jgi:hypothetical protein